MGCTRPRRGAVDDHRRLSVRRDRSTAGRTQHKGRAECRKAWQPIFDDTASRFQVEESFTLGDRVVERWTYSWDGGHIRGVDLFKVRDGKVCEKLAYVKG